MRWPAVGPLPEGPVGPSTKWEGAILVDVAFHGDREQAEVEASPGRDEPSGESWGSPVQGQRGCDRR